jgi:hypothetical protein
MSASLFAWWRDSKVTYGKVVLVVIMLRNRTPTCIFLRLRYILASLQIFEGQYMS